MRYRFADRTRQYLDTGAGTSANDHHTAGERELGVQKWTPLCKAPHSGVHLIQRDVVCTDPCCDFAEFSLTLTNSGGVGANLNFIRVENRQGTPVLELGADHFINAFGSNRVEAGETVDFILNAQLGFVVIIDYRDDNGVRGQVSLFPELPR